MANWRKKLSRPITLKTGERLSTLKDAADYLMGTFGKAMDDSVPLAYAGELLLKAAESVDPDVVEMATGQVERVLAYHQKT